MKTKLVMVALFGTVLFSCAPKVVTPAPPPVVEVKKEEVKKEEVKPAVEVLTAELAEGKYLYENNCAKCHKLFDRHEYTAQQWMPITLSMQKKAKIQDIEREKIYNYLTMK